MEKKFISILLILVFVTASCGKQKTADSKTIDPPSLNISVFLDLSDRLVKPDMTPCQMYRDTAIVNFIVDYFKKETLGPTILKSKNKLKVFCYPSPKDSEIAILMQGLSVDIGEKQGVARRQVLEEMGPVFQQNLSQIYNKTLDENNWPGCDIWDFFSSKKVDQLCVQPNSRNIIVILTDGYIYHDDSKFIEGHAYSYIVPKTLKDKQSSLIDRRNGELEGKGIEVLLLEVNPSQKVHRDQMVKILEDWFTSMGVERVMISETDADMVNTKTIIKSFLMQRPN